MWYTTLIGKCARVRRENRFIGYTRVDKLYGIPRWWPNWAVSMSQMQTDMLLDESRFAHPNCVYGEFSIDMNNELPPKQEYVVLGIFGDHERLLKEVVVYVGGPARSKHLYRGTRRLFLVPILREITSFGLYKVRYHT
jgi:hypothetical protein